VGCGVKPGFISYWRLGEPLGARDAAGRARDAAGRLGIRWAGLGIAVPAEGAFIIPEEDEAYWRVKEIATSRPLLSEEQQ
jgi:hypothetical protein